MLITYLQLVMSELKAEQTAYIRSARILLLPAPAMLHFSHRVPTPMLLCSGTPGRLRLATCRTLTVLGLSWLALGALAQELPATTGLRQPVLFNFKSGLNLSTYTGGSYIGWQTGLKAGFTGGLSATRRLSARSAWQVELLYAHKGAVRHGYWHTYSRWHAATPCLQRK